jgi:hypothetical protein
VFDNVWGIVGTLRIKEVRMLNNLWEIDSIMPYQPRIIE